MVVTLHFSHFYNYSNSIIIIIIIIIIIVPNHQYECVDEIKKFNEMHSSYIQIS